MALVIRELRPEDIPPIAAGERAQGWLRAAEDKYVQRLKDKAEGKAIAVLCAELDGEPVGYVSLYAPKGNGVFPSLPEIVDLGVLKKARRRGIGSALLVAAEALAKERAAGVYLAVGLHPGYGSAQRLYIRRGYLPDGKGAYYGETPCEEYASYPLDDDLVLYLSKDLPKTISCPR